jgi:predicted glycoside hydrolase/deacetylase ChbG (UPF0249 family)
MSGKKLIINADDFGICPETNRAVRELFQARRITSTSLLASADSTDEAIEIIKAEKINFGIHLTLNSDFSEFPWRALHGYSLDDGKGFLHFDTALIRKNARSIDVTRECEAQIKRVRDAGIYPDHLDNHSGTMYGINMRLFFINAFKLSRKYALPFRFPRRNAFLNGYFKNGIPSYIKAAHKIIIFTARMIGATIIDDIITNPYPIKDIPDYKSLESYYLNALSKLSPGVTEMFLHPSYPSERFSRLTPEWRKREYELEFLMSPALERRIKDEGIEFISYKDV